MSEIHYLSNAAIDKRKWDACVERSDNGLIYARSNFLDHLAQHWDGIIAGDYECVFPVPWKSKYGIRYVTPPVFTQQLGLIGPSAISEELIPDVLQLLQQRFKYGEYLLNFSNPLQGTVKNNFTLSLVSKYQEIHDRYQPDLKYDLRKAAAAGQTIRQGQFDPIISLYQELYQHRFPKISNSDYQNLGFLFDDLLQKGDAYLIPRLAYDNNDKLIAGILCVSDSRRIYLLLTASTSEGRKKRSIHYLIDDVIQSYAGTNLIFDFEGSDVAGIAHFFSSFGSTNQPYAEYRWNELPFPLNLIKSKRKQ